MNPLVWRGEFQASRSCLLDQVREDGKAMGAVVVKKENVTGSRRAIGYGVAYLDRARQCAIFCIHTPEHDSLASSP